MTKYYVLFGIMLIAILGCTRDDICPEDTDSTPLLIITFKDRTNPLLNKSVSQLKIETNAADPVLVIAASEATDSIAIPLDTANDLSSFRFIRDADEDDENVDILNVSYQRENSYVNRACGFKTIYNNLAAIRENEGSDNWIFSLNILKLTVEDETEAHITILH